MGLYPLRFEPFLAERVWAGERLSTLLKKPAPPGASIGESWEVSDHPNGRSPVANGPLRGATLGELSSRYGASLLGTAVEPPPAPFPLLVKYIDAAQPLSVQVHPDDSYGKKHAGELGKTEAWYVLHAEPDACLIAGLTRGTTREAFERKLRAGEDIGPFLHRIPVRSGDAVFIPAGRIHALMPGVTILEIQQSSDTTYRVYDWGRQGRALHIDDALAVTDWQDVEPTAVRSPEGDGWWPLVRCRYFQMDLLRASNPVTLDPMPASFRLVNVVQGTGLLRWEGGTETLQLGDSLLLPASLDACRLDPDGTCACVISSVPQA